MVSIAVTTVHTSTSDVQTDFLPRLAMVCHRSTSDLSARTLEKAERNSLLEHEILCRRPFSLLFNWMMRTSNVMINSNDGSLRYSGGYLQLFKTINWHQRNRPTDFRPECVVFAFFVFRKYDFIHLFFR